MRANVSFTVLLILAALLAGYQPAFAQQSPPQSAEANKLVLMVQRAAVLVESRGKAIFSEFRKSGTPLPRHSGRGGEI